MAQSGAAEGSGTGVITKLTRYPKLTSASTWGPLTHTLRWTLGAATKSPPGGTPRQPQQTRRRTAEDAELPGCALGLGGRPRATDGGGGALAPRDSSSMQPPRVAFAGKARGLLDGHRHADRRVRGTGRYARKVKAQQRRARRAARDGADVEEWTGAVQVGAFVREQGIAGGCGQHRGGGVTTPGARKREQANQAASTASLARIHGGRTPPAGPYPLAAQVPHSARAAVSRRPCADAPQPRPSATRRP